MYGSGTVLAESDITSWRDFDVELVDVTLGHNVDHTGPMSRMPTLVLTRRPSAEGCMLKRIETR